MVRWQAAIAPGRGVAGCDSVDKNVGEGRDILLAEAITNGDGSYRTTFIIGGFLQRDKERPDLQAHVFAGERLLGSSKVCYNATKRETLDVHGGCRFRSAF